MSTDPSLASRALSTPQPSAKPAAVKPAKSPLDVSLDIGFDDLIDVVNPLQHLPVISAVYREISGDTIGLGARIAGGYLYGGPIGAGSEAAMAAFEAITGDTPMGHVASLFKDDPNTGTPNGGTQVAAATATSPAPWVKDAPTSPNAPAGAPGSAAALTEALDKVREKAHEAAPTALKPQLDPVLLAQYYRLNATRADKGQTFRI